MRAYRLERDPLGEVQVPAEALYGAQTQRVVENFPLRPYGRGRGEAPHPGDRPDPAAWVRPRGPDCQAVHG